MVGSVGQSAAGLQAGCFRGGANGLFYNPQIEKVRLKKSKRCVWEKKKEEVTSSSFSMFWS